MFVLGILVLFANSALITAGARSYGIKRQVMDIPNARSSHTVPVPRGGGIGIVVTFLAAVVFFWRQGLVEANLATALLGGGFLVALIGALDDHFSLPASIRALAHVAAAGWAMWQIHGNAPLYLGWTTWNWGWLGDLIALIGIVWMINLYNFMDGIDGLAGVEGICVSAFAGMLLARNGSQGPAFLVWTLTAACAGFLVWNWPPAKIFMGDAGSSFLGFTFGVLAIASAKERAWFLWPWLILLLVFVADSTITLLRRFVRGARWYQAHRSHAYQNAATRYGSHLKIILAIAAVNILWLLPMAWTASTWPKSAPVMTLIASGPLIWTVLRFRAGKEVEADNAGMRS